MIYQLSTHLQQGTHYMQGKKQKMIVIEQLAVSNSTVLNQELNWGSTDWNKEAELIKSLLSQTNKCND